MLTQAVFFFNIFFKCNLFLWRKAEFSALLLQSFFVILLWIESSKEQHFFHLFFSYNVKVFTVIDQMNVSLLNKSTFLNIFLKKKLSDSKLLNGKYAQPQPSQWCTDCLDIDVPFLESIVYNCLQHQSVSNVGRPTKVEHVYAPQNRVSITQTTRRKST